MGIKIGLLMLSSTLAASNVAGHADTYNLIVIAAATSTTQGLNFNMSAPLPSVTGPGQETGTGIVLLGTDHTNDYNDLLYSRPAMKHVTSVEDLPHLDSSVGINLAHFYDSNDYQVEVFDPHDPVDITPFTIGFLRLIPIAIPEPSSLMLLGIGILSLAAIARKRFRRL